MADDTIWVDSVDQPWRLNRHNNRYEYLADDGWHSGTPTGSLRKVPSTPVPVPPDDSDIGVVVAQADPNTYFIQGERGLKGDQGEQGEQGPKGDRGEPGNGVTITDEALTGVRDGNNTIFTTAHAYVANTVAVYYNGLREHRGVGFIESAPSQITITSAPGSLDTIVVDYLMA